jgi:ubiquinone/menaquinone biosynthesis C-methylase UbiE
VTFDPAAIQHAYEAIAGDYETSFSDELDDNEFDLAIVDAAIASVPRGEVVLDVGCGPAQVSRRALAAGATAVGIDLTPAMLAIARRHAPVLPLALGDVLALPFRSGVAAAVIAWYSLHNLPRPLMPRALGELRRVLRTGGVAVIATHVGTGEETIEQTHDDRSETVVITYYEVEELSTLAAEHGLETTDVRGRPPLDHEHQVRKLYLTARAGPTRD